MLLIIKKVSNSPMIYYSNLEQSKGRCWDFNKPLFNAANAMTQKEGFSPYHAAAWPIEFSVANFGGYFMVNFGCFWLILAIT